LTDSTILYHRMSSNWRFSGATDCLSASVRWCRRFRHRRGPKTAVLPPTMPGETIGGKHRRGLLIQTDIARLVDHRQNTPILLPISIIAASSKSPCHGFLPATHRRNDTPRRDASSRRQARAWRQPIRRAAMSRRNRACRGRRRPRAIDSTRREPGRDSPSQLGSARKARARQPSGGSRIRHARSRCSRRFQAIPAAKRVEGILLAVPLGPRSKELAGRANPASQSHTHAEAAGRRRVSRMAPTGRELSCERVDRRRRESAPFRLADCRRRASRPSAHRRCLRRGIGPHDRPYA